MHKDMPQPFLAAGVPVLFVYIMEAHSKDGFHHDLNTTEDPMATEGKWDVMEPKTLEERAALALRCRTELLQPAFGLPHPSIFPMVLDGMDNALEAAYEARPFRAYVLSTKDGTILHKTGLKPFGLPQCRALLQKAIDAPAMPPDADFKFTKCVGGESQFRVRRA